MTDRVFRTADRFAWTARSGQGAGSSRTGQGQGRARDVLADRPRAAGRRHRWGFREPTGTAVAGADWVGGGSGASLPTARIDYVNTLKFDVDYAIEQMGPSGVKAAHLFVRKNQGDWAL